MLQSMKNYTTLYVIVGSHILRCPYGALGNTIWWRLSKADSGLMWKVKVGKTSI